MPTFNSANSLTTYQLEENDSVIESCVISLKEIFYSFHKAEFKFLYIKEIISFGDIILDSFFRQVCLLHAIVWLIFMTRNDKFDPLILQNDAFQMFFLSLFKLLPPQKCCFLYSNSISHSKQHGG